jgi:hypothetical protein
MNSERDEATLMGQVAGIIAVMLALVRALPPTARKRMQQQLHSQFESLIAAMSATEAQGVRAGREGAVWMRELFLKQIAEADKKPASGGKTPVRKELDIQF